jgi:hypothetical protein
MRIEDSGLCVPQVSVEATKTRNVRLTQCAASIARNTRVSDTG